jgi:hypothetical protein
MPAPRVALRVARSSFADAVRHGKGRWIARSYHVDANDVLDQSHQKYDPFTNLVTGPLSQTRPRAPFPRFVQAAIWNASGAIVSSTTPVTFAITGPGTIIAVDSASMTQETFRGNVRNAYQGLAFAIVQATGAGTITVTASASGLTSGSATVQATAGTFVPCSGTCD